MTPLIMMIDLNILYVFQSFAVLWQYSPYHNYTGVQPLRCKLSNFMLAIKVLVKFNLALVYNIHVMQLFLTR